MSSDKDFYIGFDIGTNSVGWAVTDTDYNLIRAKGKTLWGVRTFEEGKTAEERRLNRASRRRRERKVGRVNILKEIFQEEICKVDPDFFIRLNDSKYYIEDKSSYDKNSIFADSDYTDINFHNDYPTIYHLRKDLMYEEYKFDIRLIYLAILHIIKNRGHFLYQGQDFKSVTSFENIYAESMDTFKDILQDDFFEIDSNELKSILKNNTMNQSTKEREIIKDYNIKTPGEKQLIKLICGNKANLAILFDDESLKDFEFNKIKFSEGKYDENIEEIHSILDERFYILESAKSLYEWSVLSKVLLSKESLSDAKIASYDKHNYDLKLFKQIIKKYGDLNLYNKVFRDENIKGNYPSYIKNTKYKGHRKSIDKNCDQDEFYKYVNKVLSNKEFEDIEDEDITYILNEIELRNFMPKQKIKENSSIPYQLNLLELEKILENSSKYYDFLNDIDENGISNKEKIIKTFKFRIPYYVGPINDFHKDKGGNSWIVKKETGKITPWNFNEKVDLDASEEIFINRMTNQCSYLIGEDVLPKKSLLYSEFTVLNEINNIKINGVAFDVHTKLLIIEELYKKNKKVTIKKLKEFLVQRGIIDNKSEITGIDIQLNNALDSYYDFNKIIGNKIENKEMVEQIILWLTLPSEDKKRLRRKIEYYYGDILSSEEINKISKLKYDKWGRLSRKFLKEIEGVNIDQTKTGEMFNIIDTLRKTNDNLMEILGSSYTFNRSIKEYNSVDETIKSVKYSMLDDLYVSPAVKRSIWQTIQINEDLRKVLNKNPKKIFVEMAREKLDSKKRTSSRKERLQELYNNCKKEDLLFINPKSSNFKNDFKNLEESKLKSKKLYLYYMQMGICMYTGEPINLENLLNSEYYDIDHIYPRSLIKDDSFDNLVLVKEATNKRKSNNYPIDAEIRSNMSNKWRMLKKRGLLTSTKYDRLMRKDKLTDSELADFIARQIVETRQSTKAVASILKKIYDSNYENGNTEIVYVKAGNVGEFRHTFDLLKVRDINDYHHAKDAYLNIVVGNVYDTKFTKSPINFIRENGKKYYNLKRMYDFDVARGENIAWDTKKSKSIKIIKDTMKRNDILYTVYPFMRKGELFDIQPKKKEGEQNKLFPLKLSDDKLVDTGKYGGYRSLKGTCFMLVEHTKKGKKVRSIEPLFLVYNYILEDEKALIKYCQDTLKLNEPRVLINKININSLLEIEGIKFHLTGRTGNSLLLKHTYQLILSEDEEKYLKVVGKIASYENKDQMTKYDKMFITSDLNISMYKILENKLRDTIYFNIYGEQVKYLEEGLEVFEILDLLEQCKVLIEILNYFRCNSSTVNLSKLFSGKKKEVGKLSKNKQIEKLKSVKLINQSPSGIFESEVDLINI